MIRKWLKRIIYTTDGNQNSIDLTENDLVFITNGGCVENARLGSQNTPAPFDSEIQTRRWLGYVEKNSRAM